MKSFSESYKEAGVDVTAGYKAVELMKELMLTSNLTDGKRLKEILAENNSRMQEYMMGAGHSVAVTRALSYCNPKEAAEDMLDGMGLMVD